MKGLILIVLIAISLTTFAQKPVLLGSCEGCEAVFEHGNKVLNAVDTLPEFNDGGPRIKLTGTIYQPDGKTPAEEVILMIYHTNQKGVYPVRGDEKGWAKRQGYLRGWVKTGEDGKYTFYTTQPKNLSPAGQNRHISIPYYWSPADITTGWTAICLKGIH